MEEAQGLPVQPIIGPLPVALEPKWSWEPGEIPANLQVAYEEWLINMELDLCRVHGLAGNEAKAFLGRASGPQFVFPPPALWQHLVVVPCW